MTRMAAIASVEIILSVIIIGWNTVIASVTIIPRYCKCHNKTRNKKERIRIWEMPVQLYIRGEKKTCSTVPLPQIHMGIQFFNKYVENSVSKAATVDIFYSRKSSVSLLYLILFPSC